MSSSSSLSLRRRGPSPHYTTMSAADSTIPNVSNRFGVTSKLVKPPVMCMTRRHCHKWTHMWSIQYYSLYVITFCVSRRPREMYCGHARLCLSVCLSAATCLHYCMDLDVTWWSDRGCPLVVHYWADLQSVHGLQCYGNTMEMRGRAQQ